MENIPNYRVPQYTFGVTSNRKPVLALVIIFILILATIGSATAYFLYFNAPSKIIADCITAMSQVKSYATSGELKISLNSSSLSELPQKDTLIGLINQFDSVQAAQTSQEYKLTYNSQFDYNDLQNIKLRSRFNIAMTDITMGQVSLDAEMRIVDQKIYGLLGKLNLPDPLFIFISNLTSNVNFNDFITNTENKWIYTDITSTADQFIPLIILQNRSTDASIQKLQQLYDKYKTKIILIKSTNQIYQQNNHTVELFNYSFDKIVFKEFFLEANKIYNPDTPITQAEIKSIDEYLATNDLPSGQIGVDRATNLLARLTINFKYNDPDYKKEIFAISLNSNFDKYNENFNIQAPSPAQSLTEFFSQGSKYLMPSYPAVQPPIDFNSDQSSTPQIRDTIRRSDLSTIRNAIDIAMTSNPSITLPKCIGGLSTTTCSSLEVIVSPNKNSALGTGWIPMNFNKRMIQLPSDPQNGKTILSFSGKSVKAAYFFRSDGKEYKLATYLEADINQDLTQEDGGTQPDMYEIGTNLTSKFGI